MELQLAEDLKLDTDLPLMEVTKFQFHWKPGCHALFGLEGYLDASVPWKPEQSGGSILKIWLEKNQTRITLYNGLIVEIDICREGGTSRITARAVSASHQLDRRPVSCSFQDPSKSYGEIVRQAVLSEGGEVIRNRKTDKETGMPVIQYEETTWEFVNRLGVRLGVPIIPDIETGKPNLWFGMRNGKEVPALSEAQCSVKIRSIGKNKGMLLMTKGRDFFKIGDKMTYLGQKAVIKGVEGRYEQGELTFTYTLGDPEAKNHYQESISHPAGLGLWGRVDEVKEDMLKLALDVDGGESTGEYFYPWYPDTGNGIYAMPEKGAKVLLYFSRADEQEGAVIHCMNQKPENDRHYKDRAFNLEDGNYVLLTSETIDISRGGGHQVAVDGNAALASTSGNLSIRAEGTIKLRGRQISISTPDELNICQG
jgi:hypothetical protein